jgi:hypothetical protein
MRVLVLEKENLPLQSLQGGISAHVLKQFPFQILNR